MKRDGSNFLKGLFGLILVVLGVEGLLSTTLAYLVNAALPNWFPASLSVSLTILFIISTALFIVGTKIFWDNSEDLITLFSFALGLIILALGGGTMIAGVTLFFTVYGTIGGIITLAVGILFTSLGVGLIEYATGIEFTKNIPVLTNLVGATTGSFKMLGGNEDG